MAVSLDHLKQMLEALSSYTDNFDRQIAQDLSDILIVDGEKEFTPERMRYYKDGTRRFLQYGDDGNYSETASGHLLEPASGQTLILETAERAFYPVGNDLWPSMSRRLTQPPQTGDAVGGGYGTIDIGNFDPANVSYSGTAADGFFWFHTADTGLSEVLLVLAQGGTVVDSRTVSLSKAADILTIIEQRLNYYDVGPSVFRETYTNVADHPLDPQRNEVIGAVANDDGKGPEVGSHRTTLAVHQDAANSGLGVELGSVGVRTPGPSEPNFKTKTHQMELDNSNTTDGTWQVVGAIRGDPSRSTVKLRIPTIEIVATPGSSTNETRVIITAVDPANTDAGSMFPADHADAVPPEHSAKNSIVQAVTDNTIVGPDAGDANTDASGAATANTMTDVGGYQLAYDDITSEGSGSKTSVFQGGLVGNREIHDTDLALILVDADTAGTVKIDVVTDQNS